MQAKNNLLQKECMQDALMTYQQDVSTFQKNVETPSLSPMDIDFELSAIQKELDNIATDIIHFDKIDAGFVFINAIIGVLLDFCMDPANANGLAYALNNKNTKLGEWCNSIHEKIDHKNNPMDFQGGFTRDGETIIHGSGSHRDISFGGGDHRVRTYDHDIIRFWHAIKDYHDGVFRDGGYVDGQFIEVVSKVNSRGTPFEQSSWTEAFVKYCSHMFADFFSSKGLPCPGESFLSHASNRNLRILASDTYKEGLNMRTQVLQTIPFIVMDAITVGYVKLRYINDTYSKEAQNAKKHLLQLLTNALVSAINVGKVVITEQPQSINLPIIVHTIRLVASCVKDKIDYNQRVINKMSLDAIRTQLLGLQTYLVIGQEAYYETQEREKIHAIEMVLQYHLTERKNITDRLMKLVQNQEKENNVDFHEMELMTESLPIDLGNEEQLPCVMERCLVQYNRYTQLDYQNIYNNVYLK